MADQMWTPDPARDEDAAESTRFQDAVGQMAEGGDEPLDLRAAFVSIRHAYGAGYIDGLERREPAS